MYMRVSVCVFMMIYAAEACILILLGRLSNDQPAAYAEAQATGPEEGVRVVHTPGHSMGSISLLLSAGITGGEPVAFTGDHLVP